jgi:hypothetical protein
MSVNGYYITNDNSEDRLDSAASLTEAIRLARDWATREGQPGEPICIEHNGLTIRQFVRMPDGKVEEEEIK